MKKVAKYLSWIILLTTAPPVLSGQSSWLVSNAPDSSPDFTSLEAALASPEVLDGDWIEIAPSSASYGHVEVAREVNLRGLPDGSGGGLEPILTSLDISIPEAGQAQPTAIERLTITSLSIEDSQVNMTHCKIGNLSIVGKSDVAIERSWLDPQDGDQFLMTENGSLTMTGNLLTIKHSSFAFQPGPDFQTDLANNTILDETGQSEWVLYRGELVNNILTVPAGRLALFDVEARSNLSTRITFQGGSNTNEVDASTLFAGGTDTIEAWLPAEGGPAIGTGEDGTDIGFTGGPTPLNLDNLPGLKELPNPPPPPLFTVVEAGIGSATLQWSGSETIEGYELQIRIPDAAFGTTTSFDASSSGTVLDTLEEGTDYQFRLRSLREGLASDWATSDIITTDATPLPPSAPELTIFGVSIGSVILQWSSPETVEGFELQIRIPDAAFGTTTSFGASSSGTILDTLEEGADYQFRLRSLRDGLASDWDTSDVITTEETPLPPPAPEILVTNIEIGNIVLEWSSSESVGSYELEWREGDGDFAEAGMFAGDSTGTNLDVEPVVTTYQFRLRATRNGLVSDWTNSEVITTIEETDPLTVYRNLFGEDVTAADDWYQSGWFGWFTEDRDGYIYHLNHGSLYPIGDADSLFAYDISLDVWIWTSQLVYPSLYLFDSDPDWFLYYRGTSVPQRWYYEYSTGEDIREDQL